MIGHLDWQREVKRIAWRSADADPNQPKFWLGFDGNLIGRTKDPAFVPLAGFLDGSIKAPVPTLAEAMPGKFLFYAGRVNEVHAEPATGKTNLLIEVANKILQDPTATVLYIDPEDTPQAFAARALSFGGDPEALGGRLFYLQDPTVEDVALAQLWANSVGVTAVIIDGLAEMIARQGLDEDRPADCLNFFWQNVRPFAAAGAGVIIADHVTKSREGRNGWSRGSGAKMGHYNGVSYELEPGEEYTPGQSGFIKLKISKDRNGGVGPKHSVPFELAFDPDGEGKTLTSWRAGSEWRPTKLMDKIVQHLKRHGSATKTELLELGSHTHVPKALDLLIDEGLVTKQTEGKKHQYKLAENAGQ
ncbi:MAG: AAA family ATPase [Chthoniobacterales bacterium]